MKRFSMAFAMAAALLVFAVGCDDKKDEQPAIGLKLSVYPTEFEFNDRYESGDVKVSVEDGAEWTFVKSADLSWIAVEYIDGGLRISVEPIKPDFEDNIKSRSGRVDVKAVRGQYNRLMSIEIKQYVDDDIPADGPIHFHDETFETMMLGLYDEDENGKVSPAEASKAKTLVCSGCGIASLNGIEYFRNLTSIDCSGNVLTSVDLRKNTKLAKLDLRANPLAEVVLGYNQEIDDILIDDDSVIVRR